MSWQLLDDAVADALCPMFQALVPATSTIAVIAPFFGPKGIAASVTAASVANLSMLGASATCSEVQAGTEPYQPQGCCQEVNGRGQLIYINTATNQGGPGDFAAVRKIIRTYPGDPTGPGQPPISICEYELTDGTIRTNGVSSPFDTTIWCLQPFEGYVCVDGQEPPPYPINPPVPNHTYVDQTTNCTYNVVFQGFIQETPDAAIQPVFQISSQSQTRADGGVMGGCNLSPVIYTPGPNGPGGPGGPRIPPIPVPPNPPGPVGGVPWWAVPLLTAATSAALTLIGQELAKLSEPGFLEGSFTMTAPCDVDDQGEPQFRTWEFLEGSFPERVNAQQVAIMEMLQQHLNWKTPTCSSNEQPPSEGDWRTVSFRSDETSPFGKSRLRKRFRYRSTSGWTDSQLIDHWKDFSFEAGPIVVKHLGSSWGTPQVWAASADEGKRVIRHAAGEAGIDPDQVGRWEISGSRSSRLGVSGTMRTDTTGGFYWITARDGSNGRPLVGEVPNPGSGVD